MTIIGCVLLFFGGDLTIDGGMELAALFDVPAAIVGLFVVALGTSMPELVTSIIAAAKHESDLALGNVVGSNLFNTLAVLPISGVVQPIAIPAGGLWDLAFSWLLVAVLIPVFFLRQRRLSRVAGAILVTAYLAYAASRIAGIGV